jgi:hypothetical protein
LIRVVFYLKTNTDLIIKAAVLTAILVIQNDTALVYGNDFTNILHIFICATCDGMT